MNLLKKFNTKLIENSNKNVDKFVSFDIGDTISVGYKIVEGNSTRIQYFEGVVIAKNKNVKSYDASFVVRKISYTVGVERKFFIHSPLVEDIKLVKKGVVRRAKLYYLRKRTGKAARIKEVISQKKEKK